jgi:hypothetical protein
VTVGSKLPFEFTRRGRNFRDATGAELARIVEDRDRELEQYLAGLDVTPSDGGGGDPGVVSYVHVQGVGASVWNITHNLGWYPNVTVIDSTGRTVEGDLLHIDSDTLRLTFTGAFVGTAYLS